MRESFLIRRQFGNRFAFTQEEHHLGNIDTGNVIPHWVIAAPVVNSHKTIDQPVWRELDPAPSRLGKRLRFRR